MKTIEVFQFSELSEVAQMRVFRGYTPFTDYIYDDAYQSVKAFHKMLGIKEGGRSWLDWGRGNLSVAVLELQGLRLNKWLQNNIRGEIFTPKLFYKNWSKRRRSRVFTHCDCPLTGVCYDMDLLDPFLKFMAKPCEHTSLRDLINEAFSSLENIIEREIEYVSSFEYFLMEKINNSQDEYYTEDGILI